MRPIWKDYNITTGGTGYFHYYITESGSTAVLYEGRADALPGRLTRIPANGVCAPLLDCLFPSATGITSHPEAARTFVFSNADESGFTPVATVDFIFDWSYEPTEYGYNLLTKPINGHADPRMRFFITTYNATPSEFDINE